MKEIEVKPRDTVRINGKAYVRCRLVVNKEGVIDNYTRFERSNITHSDTIVEALDFPIPTLDKIASKEIESGTEALILLKRGYFGNAGFVPFDEIFGEEKITYIVDFSSGKAKVLLMRK